MRTVVTRTPQCRWSIRITSPTQAARALALAPCGRDPVLMPRWVVALIIILILVVFILPNPAGAGTFLGTAVNDVVTFFRSIGNSVNIAAIRVCPSPRGSPEVGRRRARDPHRVHDRQGRGPCCARR